MANELKILVILGSVREGRTALPVGQWVIEQAAAQPGLACELVDLKQWDLPFYAFAKPPAAGHYTDPLQLRWAEKVASADGYVLIAPEYNHGPSAVLKNALDFVYAEWGRKPVAFVGYGGNGAARSIEQLTCVARELTKKFETYHRGTAAEVLAWFKEHPPKGEIVLLVHAAE